MHEIPPDLLNPGGIAIDCGANVGKVTAQLASLGAIVHAFEPNPDAFAVLAERFAGHPRVTCHQAGVLDRDTSMPLYLHENAASDPVHWSTGSSLLEFKGNVNAATCVPVDLIDLASFIERLAAPVSLVKLDVEGVEARVINRLIDTGAIHRIGALLVETHEQRIPELQQEIAALRDRIRALGLSNIRLDWI